MANYFEGNNLFFNRRHWLFAVFALFSMLQQFGNSEKSESLSSLHTLNLSRFYMDEMQDPCENFFGYVCGKWKEQQEPAVSYNDSEGYLWYRYYGLMAAVFEQQVQRKERKANSVFKKARDYYESCRAVSDFDTNKYIDAFVQKHKKMSWLKVLRNENATITENNWNLSKALSTLRGYGLNDALLSLLIERQNSTDTVVKIIPPNRKQSTQFPLSTKHYENTLEFRNKLKNLVMKYANTQSDTIITVGALEEKVKCFDIRSFLKDLLGAKANDEMEIVVKQLEYLNELCELIDETPKYTVAKFLAIAFFEYLYTQQPASADPIDCLEHMNAQMPQALNYIYAEEFYNKQRREIEPIINKLYRILKNKFSSKLMAHEHEFNSEQLKFLQDKLSTLRLNIGQIPPNVPSDYFKNYYRDLRMENDENDSFYHNNLNTIRFQTKRKLELHGMSSNEPEYIFFAIKNGPSYDFLGNIIVLPFFLLQNPIFHKDSDTLFHYAGLGNIIGHEIAHAFDTKGLTIDAYGNPSDVFQPFPNGNERLQEALNCLNKVPTIRLNEKIAEFVGSNLAYEAYFTRQHQTQFDHQFTEKQLFFLQLAQFYCAGQATSNPLVNLYETPSQFLNQMVYNNRDFAAAFYCPKKEKQDICQFW